MTPSEEQFIVWPGPQPRAPMRSPAASRRRDPSSASPTSCPASGRGQLHHARHECARDRPDPGSLARVRPQARPSPDAGSGLDAKEPVRAGHCRQWIASNANPALRGANDTTSSRCARRCRLQLRLSPDQSNAVRANALACGVARRDSSSPSATSRSDIRTQDFAPGPASARQRLRRSRRTGRPASAGSTVARCRQRNAQ